MKEKIALAAMICLVSFTAAPQVMPQSQTSLPGKLGAEQYKAKMVTTIQQEADEADRSSDPQWFPTGPRRFSSGYGRVANSTKAAFAYDLQQFVTSEGEVITQLDQTYIPYQRRSGFADSWWSQHDSTFKSLLPWDKEKWKLEAILDATELRYRAATRLGVAHDSEVVPHGALMAALTQKWNKYQ